MYSSSISFSRLLFPNLPLRPTSPFLLSPSLLEICSSLPCHTWLLLISRALSVCPCSSFSADFVLSSLFYSLSVNSATRDAAPPFAARQAVIYSAPPSLSFLPSSSYSVPSLFRLFFAYASSYAVIPSQLSVRVPLPSTMFV